MRSRISNNAINVMLQQSEANFNRTALKIPTEWSDQETTRNNVATYGELIRRAKDFQLGLYREGLRPGDRVILLYPPDVDLYCVVMAVVASGMTVVFIDATMGLKKMIMAMEDSKAKMIISMGRLLKLRFFLKPLWSMKWYSVDKCGLGVKALIKLRGEKNTQDLSLYPCSEERTALITFTSGSTGRPKGTDRTHGSLIAQHNALSDHWKDIPGVSAMTGLPVMAIHYMSAGLTTVFPAMEAGKPDKVNSQVVVKDILENNVSRIVAAPAFVEKLSSYVIENQITIDCLKQISVGGAAVSINLCRQMQKAFPNCKLEILYGSTEAEPISGIFVDEALALQGSGHVVGKPVPQAEVSIVLLPRNHEDITDSTLKSYKVARGQVGELIVKGQHVLKRYVDNPEATAENKIPCPDGLVWHRTGDMAYMDGEGRIWLTGRQSDVVSYDGQCIQPYLIEIKIDQISGVERSAFILPDDSDRPVLVMSISEYADESIVLGAVQGVLSDNELSTVEIRLVKKVPVDGRHNSKIDRPLLRKQLGKNKRSWFA